MAGTQCLPRIIGKAKPLEMIPPGGERTVRNWMSGRYAPCGRHLVMLAKHSGQVLNNILSMAGRQELPVACRFADLRRKLFKPGNNAVIVRIRK